MKYTVFTQKNAASLFVFFMILFTVHCPAALSAPQGLTILFTNDTHGHVRGFNFNDMSNVGGAALRASLVNEIRYTNKKNNVETILVDSGDVFRKDPFFDVFNGEADARVMASMKYSIMCLGNHEFSVKPSKLHKFAAKAGVSLVATNVFNKSDHTYFVNPYVKRKIGGWDFYFLGVVTPETKEMVIEDNIRDITFEDPVESIERTVNKIKDDKAVIIVMVHDKLEEAAMKIARISGVDCVIAGHEHVRTVVPGAPGRAPIIEAFKYGLFLGRVDFSISSTDCHITDMRNIPVGDPEVARIIKKFEDIFRDTKMCKVIAELKKNIDSNESKRGQSALGCLLTDALRKSMNAQIGVLNSGAIAPTEWKKGDITMEMIFNLLPYNNNLEVRKITGRGLVQMLKHSYDNFGKNAFLQISGMKVDYNRDGLIQITIDNKPVVETQYYTICTTDFLFNGGDGFEFDKYGVSKPLSKALIRETVISFLSKNSQISPRDEVRIKFDDKLEYFEK
jgi:2',3'-cyclic-nucleotide 2'-phosphodiesterase (5'-nucleotidase family)